MNMYNYIFRQYTYVFASECLIDRVYRKIYIYVYVYSFHLIVLWYVLLLMPIALTQIHQVYVTGTEAGWIGLKVKNRIHSNWYYYNNINTTKPRVYFLGPIL